MTDIEKLIREAIAVIQVRADELVDGVMTG